MSRSKLALMLVAFVLLPSDALAASRAPRVPLPKRSKPKIKPDPIVSITLRRTMCFGSCPAYSVTLRRSGKADYHGKRYASRAGHHKGTVHPWTFGQLAKLVSGIGFFKLAASYRVRVTCQPSTYITVKRGSGAAKTVHVYGAAGPVSLWGVEQAIDGVAARVSWTPAVMAKVPKPSTLKPQVLRAALLKRINAQRARHKRPALKALQALDFWADADATARQGKRASPNVARQLGAVRISARESYCAIRSDPRKVALRFGKSWPLSEPTHTHIGIGAAFDKHRGWCLVLLLAR